MQMWPSWRQSCQPRSGWVGLISSHGCLTSVCSTLQRSRWRNWWALPKCAVKWKLSSSLKTARLLTFKSWIKALSLRFSTLKTFKLRTHKPLTLPAWRQRVSRKTRLEQCSSHWVDSKYRKTASAILRTQFQRITSSLTARALGARQPPGSCYLLLTNSRPCKATL